MGKNDAVYSTKPRIRCATYTRKSTEEGLEQEYNSLDAQRESCEAYIASQRHEGWTALPDRYDDGGFSGGNMDRPGLRRLIADIEDGKVDVVVTYKVDRLSRSLLDFAKLIELFERNKTSFVSVTQDFSTTTSLGRLTLNILLSFAQFERELISERVRDKIAGAKKKGKFMGGPPVIGYDVDIDNHKLLVNHEEAKTVRFIFKRFTETGSGLKIAKELNSKGITTKAWRTKHGEWRPGNSWNASTVYRYLANRIYIGETVHKDKVYPGEHEPIISRELWDKVRSMMASEEKRTCRSGISAQALLKGIIRCGHCDHAMASTHTTRKNKTYKYYVCLHATKNGYDSCPIKTVSAGEIEEAVIGQLRAVFRSPEMVAQTYRQAKIVEAEEIERLKIEKSELDLKMLRLREMAGDIVVSDAPQSDICKLNEDVETTRAELRDITAELLLLQADRITERDVMEALSKLDPIWGELFPIEQQRVVKLLIDRVVVSVDGIDVRIRTFGLHSLVSELRATLDQHEERTGA